MSTTAIRIADNKSLLYDGDLHIGCGLPDIIARKMSEGTEHLFSVYLREKGKLLYMAAMSILSDGEVNVKMVFHVGHPEHLCKKGELVKHLIHLADVHKSNEG